ncbi:hypothetical protein [Nissabacter sp. SGAir0207]|nr:hypothetical protein [Nissabacter sp. SGAir0207]
METALIGLLVLLCVVAAYALTRHIRLSRSRDLLNPRDRRR